MDNTKLNKDLGIIYDFLAKTANRLEARLLDACRQSDEPAALGTLAELLDISHVKRVSENVMADMPNEIVIPTYLLSTFTILEACGSLDKDRR